MVGVGINLYMLDQKPGYFFTCIRMAKRSHFLMNMLNTTIAQNDLCTGHYTLKYSDRTCLISLISILYMEHGVHSCNGGHMYKLHS